MEDMVMWFVLAAALMGTAFGVAATRGVAAIQRSIKSNRAQLSPDLATTLEEVPIMAVIYDRSLSVVGMNRKSEENPVILERLQGSHWFRSYLREAAHTRDAIIRPSNELDPYWVHFNSLDDGLIVVLIVDDQDRYDTESLRREFVANASHELNTPVAALSLLSEAILAAEGDPDRTQKFAQQLSGEVVRLSALTRDIARLSQAQSGWEEQEMEILDLREAAAAVAEEHSTLATTAGIELVVDTSAGSLPVRGEERSLRVAIGNLIENAIQYSSSGSRVTVGFREDERTASVTVTDQGIGIEPEHQSAIFKRFYRVDKGRSRVSGGTGLGLSIARNTARALRGDLTVWSQPGIGSTFTLRLPLWKGEHANRNPAD